MTRTQIYDMATVINPFETRFIIRGIFIEQYIQISLSTPLVYDLCGCNILLVTPFLITFIIVITYDKEVSTITNV